MCDRLQSDAGRQVWSHVRPTHSVSMPSPVYEAPPPFEAFEPRSAGPALTEAQIEFMEMKRVLETAYAASGGSVTDADVWMALGKEPPAPKE